MRHVIIGVHTPEFSFEKDLDNVRRAAKEQDVGYPVAVDSDYAIWNAFDNQYWPALYFVGQPPGSSHGVDVDSEGRGTIDQPRMYQLIRQTTPIADRQLEIEFLDRGAELFAFTFG